MEAISFINVDAKIASKAIALRIKKVIGKLLHCDQTAYMCNRNIGKLVRLINNILEYTDENDIEAILFSADFKKAFDSVEHSSIMSILRAFGFGSDFIQWVKTFFKNVESCVMNNSRPSFCIPFHFGPRNPFDSNTTVRNIYVDDFIKSPPSCDCALSPFRYPPHGHVITGDSVSFQMKT